MINRIDYSVYPESIASHLFTIINKSLVFNIASKMNIYIDCMSNIEMYSLTKNLNDNSIAPAIPPTISYMMVFSIKIFKNIKLIFDDALYDNTFLHECKRFQ